MGSRGRHNRSPCYCTRVAYVIHTVVDLSSEFDRRVRRKWAGGGRDEGSATTAAAGASNEHAFPFWQSHALDEPRASATRLFVLLPDLRLPRQKLARMHAARRLASLLNKDGPNTPRNEITPAEARVAGCAAVLCHFHQRMVSAYSFRLTAGHEYKLTPR